MVGTRQSGSLSRRPRQDGPARRRVVGSLSVAAVVVLLSVLPFLVSPYTVNVVFTILLFGGLALGLNLFTGLTGYVTFGYTAFVAVGAYSVAIISGKYGYPWLLGLIFSVLVSAAFAVAVGLPLLRVRGVYFAIATLGVAEAMRVLTGSRYAEGITNGAAGIGLSSAPPLTVQYYIMAGVVLVTMLLTMVIINGKFGLQLLAIREDELAAQTMGVPVGLWKLSAFALSGSLGGLVGGVYALHLTYINPPVVYNVLLSLEPLVMLLLGGFGTVFGPLLGAVVLTTIAEVVWSQFLAFHLLIFGFALIALILLMPDGVIPWLQRRKILPRSRRL